VALATVGALLAPAASAAPVGTPADAGWEASAYRGAVDAVKGADENQDVLDGIVFNDKNKNSKQDTNEPGIAGVTVSNGREVVTTDDKGRYELPTFENRLFSLPSRAATRCRSTRTTSLSSTTTTCRRARPN
jgi:hypothetical protein